MDRARSALARSGWALVLGLGVAGCGLIEGDEAPAGHVLTEEQEREHNAPLGDGGCGQPDLERLAVGEELFVEVEVPEIPGRFMSTVDDCDNIVLSWGTTGNAHVLRLLASGERDFYRVVEPSDSGTFPGGPFALGTDAYGNIFGAMYNSMVRLTPSGEDFPRGLFLPYQARLLKRDRDTFLVGGWNAYARLDIAANEFVWKSHGFEDEVSDVDRLVIMDAAAVDEDSFLRAMYHANMDPPIWVERVTPSKSPQATGDSEIEVLWSHGLPTNLSGIEVASAGESFAVGLNFNNPYAPCDASLDWPSRALIHRPPPCDEIQDVLFRPDGTMLSLWADREQDALKLLAWAPDEEEPTEIAQGELPPPAGLFAGLTLRKDGAAVVSAFSSDRRGIRIAIVATP